MEQMEKIINSIEAQQCKLEQMELVAKGMAQGMFGPSEMPTLASLLQTMLRDRRDDLNETIDIALEGRAGNAA